MILTDDQRRALRRRVDDPLDVRWALRGTGLCLAGFSIVAAAARVLGLDHPAGIGLAVFGFGLGALNLFAIPALFIVVQIVRDNGFVLGAPAADPDMPSGVLAWTGAEPGACLLGPGSLSAHQALAATAAAQEARAPALVWGPHGRHTVWVLPAWLRKPLA